MNTLEKTERYGMVMQLLHWGVALLVIAQLTLGKFAEVEPKASGEGFFQLHASLGALVFALMLVRIFWRLTQRMPAPFPMPAKQQLVTKAIHAGFYVVLILLVISGWRMSSAHGEAINFFGFFELPMFPGQLDRELAETCEERHELLGNALLVLFAIHTLAALKHHFVDRDGLLRRMLPH